MRVEGTDQFRTPNSENLNRLSETRRKVPEVLLVFESLSLNLLFIPCL